MEVKIDIPSELVTAFGEAVGIKNTMASTPEKPSNLTPKQMLIKLLRDFTKDTIRESEIRAGQKKGDEKVKNL